MTVLMILQGGPLDGEEQIVQSLPTNPGDKMFLSVPNYQTFSADGETVLSQGLQEVYTLVGQGRVPTANDTWDTSWVFGFAGEEYTPAPPLVPVSRYSATVVALAPTVYYRLNDTTPATMADSSGHGRNGSYSGGVTLGQPSLLLGDGDHAASFDGVTGSGSATLPAGTIVDTFTLEAWIRAPAAPGFYGIISTGVGLPYLRVSTGNLLTGQQSSFEDGTTTAGYSPSANTTMSNTAAQSQAGARSLQMAAVAAGDITCTLTAPYRVAITPGQAYDIAGWFRAATTGRQSEIFFNWYNAAGTPLNYSLTSSPNDTATGWTKATVTGWVAPPGAVALDLAPYVMGCAQGEVHYVDSLSVTPAGVDPRPKLNALASTVANLCDSGATTMVPGQVYHCVWTKSGAAQHLYMNGVDVTSPPSPVTFLAASTLYVGNQNNNSEWFPGIIDEVAVYPVALTAAQVQANYANGTTVPVPSGVVVLMNAQTGMVVTASDYQPGVQLEADAAMETGGDVTSFEGAAVAMSTVTVMQVGGQDISPPPSVYPPTVLSLNPLAYYRLGETSGTSAADSSGHGWTATYEGGYTHSATSLLVTDPANLAATLNGTTGDVASAGAQPNTGDVFTLEAWIKPATVTATGCIMSQDLSGGALYVDSTGHLSANCENAGNICVSTTTMVASNVYHVVWTKNGTANHLYINGVDVTGTVTNQTCSASTGRVFSIGCSMRSAYAPGLSFFNGTIDEVAVYGYALSPAQVSTNYHAGAG